MSDLERDQLVLHLGFLVLAVPALLVPAGPTTGWRLLLLAGLYHVATVVVALQGRHRMWLRLWWFTAVLGVLLLLPVALLAEGLGTLRLDAGLWTVIGDVPGYLALVWAVALVPTVATAEAVGRRWGTRPSWITAVLVGALLLAGVEIVLAGLGVWEPTDVLVVGGWAPYLLPAGLFLGAATLGGARWTRDEAPLRAVVVAALVALAHTGAVAASWLLVERGLQG